MSQLWQMYSPWIVGGAALAAGFLVVGLVYAVLRRLGRRTPALALVAGRTHKPVQLLVALLVARTAVQSLTAAGSGAWRGPLLHGLLVAAIIAGGWAVSSLLPLAERAVSGRLGLSDLENVEVRRARTQLTVLRRMALALVVLLTVGTVLYTFPAVRGVGTSLLASAGLLGVIGGLAAQSTLSNFFAGLQLAFGDRLRINDVVVVEGEWGRVEELTLGYVVVRIWDQRRLILPTSYFTTTPFVNWTRSGSEILGTVELDVDWSVPIPELREELIRYVKQHPLWDGRTVSMVVTDATGGRVRVRPLVSAADGSKLWDLRCAVREHLVGWLREHHPHALPRTRAEVTTFGHTPPAPRAGDDPRSAPGAEPRTAVSP